MKKSIYVESMDQQNPIYRLSFSLFLTNKLTTSNKL